MLTAQLGEASLVICLDSGCGDYERMWLTTSLRGILGGTLKVLFQTKTKSQILLTCKHAGDDP